MVLLWLSKENIYVDVGNQSKKMENLWRNDTIYFCIDDPSPPYKGVRDKSGVKVHEDVKFDILLVHIISQLIWKFQKISFVLNLRLRVE